MPKDDVSKEDRAFDLRITGPVAKVLFVTTLLHSFLLSGFAALLWFMNDLAPLMIPRLEEETAKISFPFRSLVVLIMFLAVVLGLALMLLRFYRHAVVQDLRSYETVIGWSGSAAFHSALAWIEYRCDGSKSPGQLISGRLPTFHWWLWGSACAAALVSILFAVLALVALRNSLSKQTSDQSN